MNPTLLVLAAGMGSRYGGLKQIDPMGPNGETVLDYSVYDAIRAGFTRVIFIIRESFAEEFKQRMEGKFSDKIEVLYCYQDIHDLPDGFSLPDGRTKPWGTTHAILASRKLIDSHFAVINADDFYGKDSYDQIIAYFRAMDDQSPQGSDKKDHYCMLGYRLTNTLSDHGHVNRGICNSNDGFLQAVEEHTAIQIEQDGTCRGENLAGDRVEISPEATVSMNFWGFSASVVPHLEAHFEKFLQAHGNELKSECYIPSVIDDLLLADKADCKVLETSSSWFGVTYPEDKASCVNKINELIASEEYPDHLWD